MKARHIRLTAAVVTCFGATAAAPLAFASSHREAPLIAQDPAADNTDIYAWVSPGTHDKLYVVANYSPMEEPAGGPNFHEFSSDVRYEIHITDTTRAGLPDLATYYIEFQNVDGPRVAIDNMAAGPGGGKEFFRQLSFNSVTYRVVREQARQRTLLIQGAPAAPPNYGPRTYAVLNSLGASPSATYDDAFIAANYIRDLGNNGSHGRVFAGPRDDGFYVDLSGIFDLANLSPEGVAKDGVAGFNCHSIALALPIADVTLDGMGIATDMNGKIGVWASSSRRKETVRRANGRVSSYGPWVQVSRLGLPLINEVVIGLQDKDRFNSRTPADDIGLFAGYFLNPILVRDAEAVGIYNALGVPQVTVDSLKHDRFDIVAVLSLYPGDQVSANLDKIGDILRVNLWQDSGFPNGRAIPGGAANREQADVTDVAMTLVLSGFQVPLGDNVNYNDKDFLAEFPFLPLPHSGFDAPHGKPTPIEALPQ